MILVFDIETDGLIPDVSKVHCINAVDRREGREYRFTDHEFYQLNDGTYSDVRAKRDGTIQDGLDMLSASEEVQGQNIIEYDIPVLEMLFDWKLPRSVRVRDSKVYSKTIYPALKDTDFAALRKGRLPQSFQEQGLIGKHSLQAWGIRLKKELKADFKPADFGHTWSTVPFLQEMDDYCMQDVRTNVVLMEFFEGKEYAPEAIEIEHKVAEVIARQTRYGVLFDKEAAEKLVAELQKRCSGLEDELRETFQPWYRADGKKQAPPKDRRAFVESDDGAVVRKIRRNLAPEEAAKAGKKTYTEEQRGWWCHFVQGAQYTNIKLVDFSPSSRDHIADRMQKLYDWQPADFTPSGKPKVDEDTLGSLPYEPAKKCVEYLMVAKRLGQLAEGKEAWLKWVGDDGRIHGKVNPNGAVTSRMTHYNPNLGQTPSAKSEYGPECRGLFIVPKGKKLVGCDADALELRMQAHYLARFDDGEFVKITLEGNKDDGTDMHTRNQKSVKFHSRDNTKTLWYAQAYGAQGFKLGTIVIDDFPEEKRAKFYESYPAGKKRKSATARLGDRAKQRLVQGITGFDTLLEKVQKSAKRGYLVSLDGRKLPVRSQHAALNTLLQGGGSIVMKKALCIADDTLQDEHGLTPGKEYEWVLNVHDEFQAEVDEEYAELVGRVSADAIRQAGEHFGLRCPLAGNYDIGDSWRETH